MFAGETYFTDGTHASLVIYVRGKHAIPRDMCVGETRIPGKHAFPMTPAKAHCKPVQRPRICYLLKCFVNTDQYAIVALISPCSTGALIGASLSEPHTW